VKRLILIDAHALIHRAYHALPPLSTPRGEPINAVYGFTSIFLRILKELKPDYLIAAFDLPGPTFRHVAYERYKAQRPETPSDLSSQFSKTEEVLEAFGVPVIKKEGYEADDIIGTIAEKFKNKKDLEIIIVTGDMDALQLVGKRLQVYTMKKGVTETIVYDEKMVFERYGLRPEQLIDFKGLKGDPSDNIPGVKGIGEKTAISLIQTFGSIEGVYKALKKNTAKISTNVATKLKEGEEAAQFSRELATINREAPVSFTLEESRYHQEDRTKVKTVFQNFGFFSLLKRLEAYETPTQNASQVSLLGGDEKKSVIEEIDSTEKLKKVSSQELALACFEKELFLVTPQRPYRIKNELLSQKETKGFFQKKSFAVYDGKSILHLFKNEGIALPTISFDLGIASYLTALSARDFSFLAIASRELGRLVSQDPIEELTHFFEIKNILERKLSKQKADFVFSKIEMPLVPVLVQMEEYGVLMDTNFLKKFSDRITKELSRLTKTIYDTAGEEFNINSSQQLSRILFDVLGIRTLGLRKTEKGGVISTRESELVKLRSLHPIIDHVLRFRELMKLKTTYVEALPELVDPKTGRLHTTFNQMVAATGRLSSQNPNLQNIPIQSLEGREIRKAFVAEKDFEFVSFDYSQIELRVAAHIANDKKMIEFFKKGEDIHRMTASTIYNISPDKVTSEQRRAAKTLNFGVLYGMGSQAFAEGTGFSREEARKFIDDYFANFSGIKNYVESTKQFVEETGYVETIFGRRRFIPEIVSANWQLKREAERMAVNMPIQGTAADLVKIAMVQIADWITKEKLGSSVRMLLQVHDELVFEVKGAATKKYLPQIKKIMEGAAKLKVPLIVDVKVGKSWGDQKVLDF